jgi:hypothetical protein
MAGGWLAQGVIACPHCGLNVQKLGCYKMSSEMTAFPESGRSSLPKQPDFQRS